MAIEDRPKLRLLRARRRDQRNQKFVELDDPMGLVSSPILIPLDGYLQVVRYFDGETTLGNIQNRILETNGHQVDLAELEELVDQLDQSMILDGPTYRRFREAYASESIRPSAMAGRSYAGNAVTLRAELDQIFKHPSASGIPSGRRKLSPTKLRGILCPHIDFGRGGPVYTWAYRELVERSDADIFIILGVAHQPCRNRFALTLKDFETPLGTTKTNQAFVNHIANQAGSYLFDDELAHRTEHSIEFQVVLLQYLLGERRDISIVPILVGSFHDLMERGVDPIDDPEVRRTVEAIQSAEAGSGKKVAYIGGVDLCHVGPEFGDADPVDDPMLERIRSFDQLMLGHAARLDPIGWFKEAAEVENRWRVCGLAATYTMLHAMGPAHGRLLRYDQAINPSRTCCVSFASMAYDAEV